jgi:hypothetical protein
MPNEHEDAAHNCLNGKCCGSFRVRVRQPTMEDAAIDIGNVNVGDENRMSTHYPTKGTY